MMLLIIFVLLAIVFIAEGGILIAAKCVDGIAVSSDALDASGSYVSNRNSKKVFILTDSVAVCCANDATAEFQCMFNDLREHVRSLELQHGQTFEFESIARLSRKLINSKYRGVHCVVAGTGKDVLLPPQFGLCEILPKGSRIDSDLVVAGSGSQLVVPLLEESFKGLNSPTVNDAVPLLNKAVLKATALDHQCGGRKPKIWILHRLMS